MTGNKKYRPLPGFGSKWFSSNLLFNHSLWVGDNHLLSIKGRPFWEDYRRFYFKDIQSVICRKTSVGKVMNALMGLFILLALIPVHYDLGQTFWWICIIVNSVFLIFNIVRGPTCVCHLQTSAQVEKLPRLDRIKKAEKFTARLKPLVEAAQGGVLDRSTADIGLTGQATSTIQTETSLRHEPGHFHLGLFIFLLAYAALIGLDLYFDHPAIVLASTVLTMITSLLTIVCLVKQQDGDLSGSIRNLAWGSLVFMGLVFMAGFLYSTFMAVRLPAQRHHFWGLAEEYSRNSPGDIVWLTYVYLIFMVVSIFISLPGLILILRHRRSGPGRQF